MRDLVVEAYAGYKGEETPRAFTHGGQRYTVKHVVDRWYGEEHAYFRVDADDGYRYVLRYDLTRLVWELVMKQDNVS